MKNFVDLQPSVIRSQMFYKRKIMFYQVFNIQGGERFKPAASQAEGREFEPRFPLKENERYIRKPLLEKYKDNTGEKRFATRHHLFFQKSL